MPFAIRAGDIETRLDDLPIGEFQQVAKRHNLSWFDLWNTPAQEPDAFYELVELAVRHGGGTLPQRPATVKDTLTLISECLQVVDDDLPTMWEDGNPPEADQTTA